MYQKSRKRQGIIIIIAIIVLVVVISVIIYPTINNIIKINQQITAERIDLEYKLANGLNITKTKKDLDEINQTINTIDSVLIDTEKEIEFIQLLENLAIQNNIAIDIQSNFIGTESNKLYTKTPLTLIITGQYNDIIRYITTLESLPNYFNLETFSAIKNSGSTSYIKTQIDGYIYIKLPSTNK